MVLFFSFITLLVGFCNGARILVFTQSSSQSHWVVIEPLLTELVARGHQITVFTSHLRERPLENYTEIDLSKKRPSSQSVMSLDFINEEMSSPWQTVKFLYNLNEKRCSFLKDPEFQSILKKKDSYDLVMTELFGNDCFTYFAYKLKVPLVSFTTSMALPWAAERLGLPDNPSYIPNYLVNFSPEMNLLERTYNTAVLLYAKFWHQWVYSRQTQSWVEEAFGEPLPPLDQVVANTSLLLVNSYHALSQSRPFPPNVVEVGGIHIKERKPLPEDLQTILDESKNGVILVSFGSLVRSSTLPKSTINTFLSVFAKVPQTIIFKYEDDLPEAPENVVVRKWLPQRDLIEHENVVAVIAHGGLGSTIEAVYFGKPLIGIPFYCDQFVNIKNLVSRGGGLQLDLNDLTEENIATAMHEITTNAKYKEGIERMSQQYRDRPMSALQSAVFWTEYVIRHQGAPHLQPASVRIPIYQYLLLDVIALLVTSLTVLLYVTHCVTSRVFKFVGRGELTVAKIWIKCLHGLGIFKQPYQLYCATVILVQCYVGLSQKSKKVE